MLIHLPTIKANIIQVHTYNWLHKKTSSSQEEFPLVILYFTVKNDTPPIIKKIYNYFCSLYNPYTMPAYAYFAKYFSPISGMFNNFSNNSANLPQRRL